jgi:hypothetical protein
MNLFENSVKLRGYLSGDPEVPTPDADIHSSHMLLILTVESGRADKDTGAWITRALEIGVVCAGPDFAGVTPDMQADDYLEVEGEIDVLAADNLFLARDEHIAAVTTQTVIRAVRVRKLSSPAKGDDD